MKGTDACLVAPQTGTLSVSVGMACSVYQPLVVLEALALTASVVTGLTLYTFYAERKGVSFSFLGPLLFAGLWVLVIWSFIQLFFMPGPVSQTIFALLGTVIFSGYIVYDTHLLIERKSSSSQ
jgi:protein lifeguard